MPLLNLVLMPLLKLSYIALLVGAVLVVLVAGDVSVLSRLDQGVWILILAVVVYLLSHVLRTLRLFLILFESKPSLLKVVLLHMTTAAASMALPFKLGELFRIAELSSLLGRLPKAVAVVMVERYFDFIALSLIVLAAVPAAAGDWPPLAILLFIFLISAAFAYQSAPRFVQYARHMLVSSNKIYSANKSLKLLSLIESLHLHISSLIRGRSAIIIFLTLLIWAFELLAIFVIFFSLKTMLFSETSVTLIMILNIALTGGGGQNLALLNEIHNMHWLWVMLVLPLVLIYGVYKLHQLYQSVRFSGRHLHRYRLLPEFYDDSPTLQEDAL